MWRRGTLTRVNVALAGYGWWGRKMAKLITERSTLIRVAVIVEPHEDARRGAVDAGYETEGDLAAVVARADVEAVILATPHPSTASKSAWQRRPVSTSSARSPWP